jgi:hypothetical protein
MIYTNIGQDGSGLTNQLFMLVTSILYAYYNNEKVIIIDKFLDDISKNEYTEIKEIINIEKTNIYLKNKFNLIIADKYDINFKLNYIKYGIGDNIIDLTDEIFKKNKNKYNKNYLFISKETNFNEIKGDPKQGFTKKIILNYTINDNIIEEIYDENLKKDISIDFINSYYDNYWGWINSHNQELFENILINIVYNDTFINNSIIKEIDIDEKKKVNIIHLRLENDGLKHWSRMNNMNENEFEMYITNKYIEIIKKNINKDEKNIILSNSLNNKVIDFLRENNYNFIFNEKYFKYREKDAIIDFLISTRYCNNIFIGNFILESLNGSTFSYYIMKCLKEPIKKICINLDKIYNDERVYY